MFQLVTRFRNINQCSFLFFQRDLYFVNNVNNISHFSIPIFRTFSDFFIYSFYYFVVFLFWFNLFDKENLVYICYVVDFLKATHFSKTERNIAFFNKCVCEWFVVGLPRKMLYIFFFFIEQIRKFVFSFRFFFVDAAKQFYQANNFCELAFRENKTRMSNIASSNQSKCLIFIQESNWLAITKKFHRDFRCRILSC